MLQEAATATVANRPAVGECGVRREVDFGGVVPEEDDRVRGHRLAGERSVGVMEGIPGRRRGVAASVEPAEVVPVEDGVEGPLTSVRFQSVSPAL